MKDNILIDKSLRFAARIIKLNKYLISDKKETVISRQIIRSGTSIGANIHEANYGQSRFHFKNTDCFKGNCRNRILAEIAYAV